MIGRLLVWLRWLREPVPEPDPGVVVEPEVEQ